MSMRLDHRPGEVIDRGREFTFTWNGEEYPAYEGDTIISALAACGERVFSRSFKYHRPRGLLSASFVDPGCMVQVDDEPNVRGAHRRVEPGMTVSPQGVWPSLARMRLLRQWAGLCDMTPDFAPIMGVTPVEGFLVDVGWGTYGFKAGPVSGDMMAELIATGKTPELIAPFGLDRFGRGDLMGEKGAAAVGH